jgi:hypothetical protein
MMTRNAILTTTACQPFRFNVQCMRVRDTRGLTPNLAKSVLVANANQQIWDEPGFFRDERRKNEMNPATKMSYVADLTESTIRNTLSANEAT